MLPRAWVRALCLAPLLLLVFPVSPAYAAYPAAHAGRTQSSPSPTPTPAAPDQSKPADTAGASSPAGNTQSSSSASQGAQSTTSNATGLRREVFGYATAASLADPTVGYPSWNFDDLSTVAFFSIRVQYDGQLVGDSNFAVFNSSTFDTFLSTAHAHGTKVVVTITGPNNPVDLCDALYNDQTNTIPLLMTYVKSKGVDGVNIDYEGQIGQCQNVVDPTLNTTNQALMTKLAKDMRAALDAIKPGYYLSIATYSGSASANDGFFNIPNLNPYVDSFFVMSYDMDEANQPYAPLNCSSFCFAPVSPLNGYYWNDSTSMSQYSALVGAGKVILGQPYYGRVGCVSSPSDHATLTSNFGAATYLGAASVASSPDVQPGTYGVHRDDYDPNGQDRWDSWYDNSLGCWRVMHWSDTTTLGVRYNLVNQMNLRGVGLWTLNYGGGSSELWSALQTYFKGCYSVAVAAAPSSPSLAGTSVTVTANAGCPDASPEYQFWLLAPGASSYQLVQPYSTSNTFTWNTAGSFPGTYRFSVWAKDSGSSGEFGNSLGRWDAYNSDTTYVVTTNPCSSLGTAMSPASGTEVGTPVTVTGQAAGCPSPQYQFWILAPGAGSYKLAQAYSSNAALNWATAGLAPGTYSISVWVRDMSSPGTFGNALGRWDAFNTSQYTLTACTSLSVSAVPQSPVAVGTAVTISARAAGCTSPQYQFWIQAPGAAAFTLAQAYSATSTFAWSTTGLAPGTYRVSVWARDAASGGAAGNSLGSWDAYNTSQYSLGSCTGATVSAAPASQAAVGTSVTLTAHASGCANPQYQFWILAPGATAYTMAQAYSATATYTWSTNGAAPGAYRVSVWVRDAASAGGSSNNLGSWDTYANLTYTLTSCSGVSVSYTPSASAKAGTVVTIKAVATGCSSPQYQFWILAPGGTAYQVVQAYSSANTFTWNTTGLAPGTYQVSVWVKDSNSSGGSGNQFGRWDAYVASQYAVLS